MGLLDKVKEQAAVATAAAKEAAQKGQDKLGDLQAKRAADALLRDLGLTTFLEKAGRATSQVAADAEKLIGQLKGHEATHGPIDSTPTAQTTSAAPAADPTTPPAPPPSSQHI